MKSILFTNGGKAWAAMVNLMELNCFLPCRQGFRDIPGIGWLYLTRFIFSISFTTCRLAFCLNLRYFSFSTSWLVFCFNNLFYFSFTTCWFVCCFNLPPSVFLMFFVVNFVFFIFSILLFFFSRNITFLWSLSIFTNSRKTKGEPKIF